MILIFYCGHLVRLIGIINLEGDIKGANFCIQNMCLNSISRKPWLSHFTPA